MKKLQILFVNRTQLYCFSSEAILITIKLFEREGIASPDVEQQTRLMRSYLSLKNNEVLSLVGVF